MNTKQHSYKVIIKTSLSVNTCPSTDTTLYLSIWRKTM